MDPEGAIHAIATNMAKKKKGESLKRSGHVSTSVPLIATIQRI